MKIFRIFVPKNGLNYTHFMKEWFEWINFDIAFPITDLTWYFFLVVVIILFAPILLERLRLPHIIGLMLAGRVVG